MVVGLFAALHGTATSPRLQRITQMHFPCSTAYGATERMAQEEVLKETSSYFNHILPHLFSFIGKALAIFVNMFSFSVLTKTTHSTCTKCVSPGPQFAQAICLHKNFISYFFYCWDLPTTGFFRDGWCISVPIQYLNFAIPSVIISRWSHWLQNHTDQHPP